MGSARRYPGESHVAAMTNSDRLAAASPLALRD